MLNMNAVYFKKSLTPNKCSYIYGVNYTRLNIKEQIKPNFINDRFHLVCNPVYYSIMKNTWNK